MAATGILRFFGFSRTTQPAHERALLAAVTKEKWRRIVEIGVGSGERAVAIIKAAQKQHANDEIRLTGIDMFEARTAASVEHALKSVHRRLIASHVAVRLVPGDAASALPRCANDLRGTDLVLVAGDQDPESLQRAWHFLPRMLHQHSQVWMENVERTEFEVLTAKEISEQVALRCRRRAA